MRCWCRHYQILHVLTITGALAMHAVHQLANAIVAALTLTNRSGCGWPSGLASTQVMHEVADSGVTGLLGLACGGDAGALLRDARNTELEELRPFGRRIGFDFRGSTGPERARKRPASG